MNINKINEKKSSFLIYIPFVIFFLIMFIWHFMLHPKNDDLWFSAKFFEQNIFSYLTWRYETWTSRVLIEFLLVPLAGLPRMIWNFLDSIVFVLIAVLIPKITLNTKNIKEKKLIIYNSLSCILVLIYIFTISNGLSSAGYIATTLNYTWPLFFGLLHFYLVKTYIFNENNLKTPAKIAIYLIMFIALIFAINQELMLFLISEVYFFIILYCIYNKVKIPNIILLTLSILFLSFLNFYLCPGNHLRYIKEISTWLPDYYKLTLVNKIDLGITVLFNRIILSYGLINLFFLGVLGVYVHSITKKKISILISLTPIIIIVILGLMILIGYIPIVEFLNEGVTQYGLLNSDIKHISIIFIIYSIIIFSVIYNLIQIYKYKGKKFSSIIFCLLIIGIASQLMRGFSPTCWATGERWEIYYYFFITFATYILTIELLENKYNKGSKITFW
jgi:hypothetical protein